MQKNEKKNLFRNKFGKSASFCPHNKAGSQNCYRKSKQTNKKTNVSVAAELQQSIFKSDGVHGELRFPEDVSFWSISKARTRAYKLG